MWPPQITRFMGTTWDPSGADRSQVGPMLAPWTLLSGSISSTSSCIQHGTVKYRAQARQRSCIINTLGDRGNDNTHQLFVIFDFYHIFTFTNSTCRIQIGRTGIIARMGCQNITIHVVLGAVSGNNYTVGEHLDKMTFPYIWPQYSNLAKFAIFSFIDSNSDIHSRCIFDWYQRMNNYFNN